MQYSRLHYSLLIYLLNGWMKTSGFSNGCRRPPWVAEDAARPQHRVLLASVLLGARVRDTRSAPRTDAMMAFIMWITVHAAAHLQGMTSTGIYITNISTIFVFILSRLRVNMQ